MADRAGSQHVQHASDNFWRSLSAEAVITMQRSGPGPGQHQHLHEALTPASWVPATFQSYSIVEANQHTQLLLTRARKAAAAPHALACTKQWTVLPWSLVADAKHGLCAHAGWSWAHSWPATCCPRARRLPGEAASPTHAPPPPQSRSWKDSGRIATSGPRPTGHQLIPVQTCQHVKQGPAQQCW
jgi:hypothetical protein